MRIKQAAMIWDEDGKVYMGQAHASIIRDISYRFPAAKWPIKGKQGFITDDGTFVDRIEGLRIAKAAGQIKHKHGNQCELYSEDINYPDGPPTK